MNTLRKEIRGCLRELALREDGSVRAIVRFPPDFIGFKGHFPDRPVLPGVCQVQAVVVVIEAGTKQPVQLREIEVAKFFAAVGPDEDLEFVCREQATDEETARVSATIRSGDKKVAEVVLRIRRGTKEAPHDAP